MLLSSYKSVMLNKVTFDLPSLIVCIHRMIGNGITGDEKFVNFECTYIRVCLT